MAVEQAISRWPMFGHLGSGGRLGDRLRLISALFCLLALGWFLARAPLAWCVLVVLGSAGLFLLLLHPAIALYALAFAVPFGSLREFTVGGVTIGASELLVGGLIGAWLLRMAATRRVELVRSWFTLGVLGYLATVIISLWPATDLVPAVKELTKWRK